MEDAKREHFTDCSTDSLGLRRRGGFEWGGERVQSASVWLHSPGSFDPATARFEGVQMTFACKASVEAVLSNLRRHGWRERSWKGHVFFVKVGVPAEVDYEQFSRPDVLKVNPSTLTDVNHWFAEVDQQRARTEKAARFAADM